MRASLLLALALTLAACDASGPDAPPAIAPGFEATVAAGTSGARTLKGSASASGELSGQFTRFLSPEGLGDLVLTGIELRADDSADTFLIVGITEEELASGDYDFDALTFGGNGAGDSFFLLYLPDGSAGDPNNPPALAVSTGGTLTVTASTEERLAGSFAATVSLLGDSESEISVEGTFVATAQER